MSYTVCMLQETHGSGLEFDGMEHYVAELLAASQEFMRKQEVNSEIKQNFLVDIKVKKTFYELKTSHKLKSQCCSNNYFRTSYPSVLANFNQNFLKSTPKTSVS